MGKSTTQGASPVMIYAKLRDGSALERLDAALCV